MWCWNRCYTIFASLKYILTRLCCSAAVIFTTRCVWLTGVTTNLTVHKDKVYSLLPKISMGYEEGLCISPVVGTDHWDCKPGLFSWGRGSFLNSFRLCLNINNYHFVKAFLMIKLFWFDWITIGKILYKLLLFLVPVICPLSPPIIRGFASRSGGVGIDTHLHQSTKKFIHHWVEEKKWGQWTGTPSGGFSVQKALLYYWTVKFNPTDPGGRCNVTPVGVKLSEVHPRLKSHTIGW